MSEQPTAPTTDSRQFDVVLVDQSHDARMAARAEADARLTGELGEGGRIRRFATSVWKGNIAKDYYRHKYEQQALKHIESTQDILAHESSSREHRDGAMYATIQRFQSQYEEMVHSEAGETRNELETGEISDGIKGLIRQYAEGTLDDTSLIEERTRLLQAYRDESGDLLAGDGLVQVDNMIDVARAVRGAVTHGESLDDIINGMRIITAESRAGVRSQVEYSRTDQVIEKLSKSKLGLILGSEATIAAASIAASVARFGSHKAVGAAAMTIAPGVGAGLLAGLREKKRVKDDRAQHAREMAQGKAFNEGDSRREEMEATRYETVEASSLIESLRSHLEDGALESDDALQAALDQLAAIRAREYMSDTRTIDLIAYSDATAVERERFDLALARAEVKVALNGRLDDEARGRLTLDQDASIDELINASSDTFIETYETDIDAKDAAFRKLRNRRVAKAAATGALLGTTFGVAAQEFGATLSDTREGLVEQAWNHDTVPHDGSVHETLLQGAFGSDEVSAGTTGSEIVSESKERFGENGTMRFTDNLSVDQHNGRLAVSAAGGGLLADLKLRPDGTIGDGGLAKLEAAGVNVQDLTRTVLVESTETKTVGLDQFMQNHQSDTTQVTRDLWYDNDTANSDLNELGLHWGGQNGIGENGNVVMSVATMQTDGSFNGGEGTDWAQDNRADNLKLAISPSGDTQATPFLVDIDRNGNAIIPPDSPAAQLFSVENGQTVFNGRYAEVLEMTGKDGQGVEHVRALATLVGNDSVETVKDTITTQTAELRPKYEFSMPPESGPETTADVPSNNFVEMAPVIPIVPRRPLERLVARAGNRNSPGDYNVRYGYENPWYDRSAEFSPRLRDNASGDLVLGQEVEWFESELRTREGDGYVQEIHDTIDASNELRELSGELKTITTIPVAAANENKNIYGTLSLYAQQDPDQLSRNAILLNVNWLDVAKSDPQKQANIDETFAEIERARRDFPQLNIAVMTREYEAEKVKATGGVIGYVASDLMNTALLAIRRRIESGNMAEDNDVAIIRQDADMNGMSRNYLKSLEAAMKRLPGVDIFNGVIRSDTERQRNYPGFGLVTNFSQSLRAIMTAQNKPFTVGINTVARASSLAAVSGLGKLEHTGAASDDMQIGWRIGAARRDEKLAVADSYYQPSSSGLPTLSERKIVAQVPGLTVDSAADRLIPHYLNGRHFGAAWNNNEGTNFDDGPGGYRERDADAHVMERKTQEKVGSREMFTSIEVNLTEELRNADEAAGRKALAIFFGAQPGAYTITGRIGQDCTFRLTRSGRRFVKQKLSAEKGDRRASYGARKARQLYGMATVKRQPKASSPPLVAPLA